jgi:peptidoglycan/LPS O-acetylase OafA/YrhL
VTGAGETPGHDLPHWLDRTMETATPAVEPLSPRRRRRLPWTVVVVLSLGAVYLAWRLRAEATVACDVGVNAGSAMLGPSLATPFLVLGCLVAGGLWRHLLRPAEALVAVLATYAVVVGVTLAVTAPPGDYPEPVATCAGGTPDWWPGWLPG